MGRKLVTLRRVSNLEKIPNADRILLAKVDGWQCVVKKEEFEVGDWGLFFEIDSMIPHEDWNDHLFKNQKDIDKGVLRIKTIRLRSTLSQGLMIPLSALEGKDLTEAMQVTKYEPPVPQDMSAKSRYPSFIQKTDEERVQNLVDELHGYSKKLVYESEKLDGSSITIHCVRNDIDDGWTYGVSSRNLELKLEIPDIEDGHLRPVTNKFVTTARNMNLEDKMRAWCKLNNKDLVLQGELIGIGVQSNRYDLPDNTIRFYTAQDGKHMQYIYYEFMKIINFLDLDTVPIIVVNIPLTDSLEKLLAYADGTSELNPNILREGVIYRAMDGSFSFKVVSNKFLLKNGE